MKKMNIKMKTLITMMLCVALFTFPLSACSGSVGKNTVDLDNYVVVTYSGYDGYGQANTRLDTDALQADYGDKLSLNTKSSAAAWYQGESVASIISEFAGCWTTPYEGLSNGDSVELTWSVDSAVIEELLNCSVIYDNATYTVEGLEEIGTVNVFDGVDVSFTGVAPLGNAELTINNQFNNGSWSNPYSYTLSQSSDLSNGDTVTVSFDITDQDAFIQEFGAMPESTTAEATVSGLDSYVTEISQLSSEDITALESEALDQLDAYVSKLGTFSLCSLFNVSYWGQSSKATHGNFELQQIFIYTPKVPGSYHSTELSFMPVFVYKAPVTAQISSETYSGEIYFTVKFSDLIIENSGNLVGYAQNNVADYGNYDDLYRTWITDNKDDYNIEIHDVN